MPDPVVQPIPEEALARAVKLAYENSSDEWPAPTHGDIQAALIHAAPIIDRAARIDELRKLADDFDQTVEEFEGQRALCDEDGLAVLEGQIIGVEFAADHIRSWITELEAQS